MNALKAKEFYRRDVQYMVKNGKALIINEVFFPKKIESLILLFNMVLLTFYIKPIERICLK